jgi:hypothetical protein
LKGTTKMQSKFKRLVSLLTSSALLSSGLVLLTSTASVAALAPSPITVTFEPNDTSGYRVGSGSYNGYNPDFGGMASSLIVSPVAGNTTTVSKQVIGGDPWSGTTFIDLGLGGNSGGMLFSGATYSASVDVYSTFSGNITLKAEGSSCAGPVTNGGVEMSTSHGGSGWETLTFSSSAAAGCSKASLMPYIFDANRNGVVIYFDNASFPGALVDYSLSTPSTLLSLDAVTNYDVEGFGGGAVTVKGAGTPTGAGSANALKITRTYGDCWAGVTLTTLTKDKSLLSQGNTTVRANVYVPTAGANVLMKLEDSANSSIFLEATSVAANAGWNLMEWSFSTWNSANPNRYNKANVFPGFSCAPSTQYAGDYFIDDVAFNGATPAALTTPQAFQLVTTLSQAVQYNFETAPAGWEPFEGASAGLVATPAGANAPTGTNSGYITESDTVGVQPWAGLTVDVRTSTELISATSKIVQLRVKAPTATTSVTLKLEAPGNASNGSTPNLFVEKSATAGTTSWQVLTFDFTSPSAGNYTEGSAYNKIVLFFNLGTKDPISQTLYFDDLAFTPNAVDLSQSAAPRTGENKGNYPHLRLDKSFMDTYLDATWWDGVWQYRDEDTRAYLKYIPVRSTFKLTYTVTDKDDKPLANAPVTLIVNANYSCAKTFFMYENTLIGPDDCAGNGETQLPAKLTDADGKVTFVLTNTNAEGEKMPASLNGAPNGKELGTNIKPHLVGATREGVDMLFAHFVEQSDAAKVVAPATQTVKTGTPHVANFQFLDEAGKPMANQLAEVYINGVQSKQDWVLTDAQGRIGIPVPNPQNLEGTSAVAVSVKRTGLLPLTATTMVAWEQGAMKVSMAPASNSVEVKVVNAANESVKITINGKSYERTPTTGLVTYKFPATVGKKVIRVTIGKKTFVRGVTVRR